MSPQALTAAAILLCMALGAAAVDAAPDAATPATQHARLASLLSAYEEVYGFSGAVRVSRDREVLFDEALGLAERAFAVPYRPGTRQPINSISKVFTAVAALRLAQSGRLDLDAPVSAYLPDLNASWADEVTVHHLLSHGSGLPREAGLEAHSALDFEAQLDIVETLAPGFEPGSRYGYSNAGFIVLGALLEAAGERSYAALIEEEVLAPLALEDTGVLHGRRVVERQAVPYRMSADGVVSAQRTKTLGASAGGGLYSNGADLHTLMHALRGTELLGQEARRRLVTVVSPPGGEVGEAYALSIQSFGDRTIWLAAGSGYGAKSVVIHVPDDAMVVSILSNWGNTPVMAMLRDVYLTLAGQPVELPDRRGLASPAAFADVLGRYRFDEAALRQALQMDSGTLHLHVSDGKLFLDDELMAAGEEAGQLRLTYTEELVITFEDDAMLLSIGGQTLRGARTNDE